jgi:HEAT repeat protein
MREHRRVRPFRSRRSLAAAALVCFILSGEPLWAQSTSAPASDPPRVEQLTTLILDERQTPANREFLVRELLSDPSAEASSAVLHILTHTNDAPTLTSLCQVLAEVGRCEEGWFDALVALLRAPGTEVREAAARGLGACRADETLARVGTLAADRAEATEVRLAATRILGGLADRKAALNALISLLGDPQAEVRSAARGYLVQVAPQDFGEDAEAWRQWWSARRNDPPEVWPRALLESRKRELLAAEQRIRRLEQQNLALLRQIYDRSSEAERKTKLAEFLREKDARVRLLGLEIVSKMISDRQEIPAETLAALRELVAAPSVEVRRGTITLLMDLRAAEDAALLIGRLGVETDGEAQRSLVRALGRLGDADAVEPLLVLMGPETGDALAGDAAESLALLVTGSAEGAAWKDAVAAALLERFESVSGEQKDAARQLLSAMSTLADPSFLPVFLANVESSDRERKIAALRGLREVGDASHLPLMMGQFSDPGPRVRRAVAEALGKFGENELHLEALLAHLDAATEADESVRNSSWDSFTKVFAKQPLELRLSWAARLDPKGRGPAATSERYIALLGQMEKDLGGVTDHYEDLMAVQTLLASANAEAGNHAEALRYLQIVHPWLKGKGDARALAVAATVLGSQLRGDRPDLAVSLITSLLAEPNAELAAALAEAVNAHVRGQIERKQWEEALSLCDELTSRRAPGVTDAWLNDLAELSALAVEQRNEEDAARVAELVSAMLAKHEKGGAVNGEREQILALGPRATAGLTRSLRKLIGNGGHAVEQEKLVADLLRQIHPNCPDYDAGAPVEVRVGWVEAVGKPNAVGG